jgi:dCMP deaminase
MQTLVAYVPVLHEGYRCFFEKYDGEKQLFIFGPEITAEFSQLRKEIRELEPELMKQAIEALGIFASVEILDRAGAEKLAATGQEIIMPDEDVSRELAEKYFSHANVQFDPIFLRWDKHNSIAEKPVVPDEFVTKDELHRAFIQTAQTESEKSSDIWRHVGACVVKDGEMLFSSHNAHVPSEHIPYVNGDPRSNFHKGEHIELSTALHAEAALIAEAARRNFT